jgi:hypothetical protein
MYSEDRCTNWTDFDPAWAEVQAVYKKIDGLRSQNLIPENEYEERRKHILSDI